MGSLHIEFFHNNSPGIERYPGTPHVRGKFLFVVCVKRSNCFLTVTPLFLNHLIFLYKFFFMFKDKEIMNKLNISRQAVYNNKNKALKNLRKMLEQ